MVQAFTSSLDSVAILSYSSLGAEGFPNTMSNAELLLLILSSALEPDTTDRLLTSPWIDGASHLVLSRWRLDAMREGN